MNKLDQYIFRKYLGTFFYAISLIILIVIVFDVSEKIDDFLDKKAPIYDIIFHYYVPFIPYFINLFSPLFTFIAVIFFTSRMASHTEIIAMLGSGISFNRILRPYMWGALVIGIMSFCLGNFIIPNVNKIRVDFERKYVRRAYVNNGLNIHFQQDKNTFLYVESFDNNLNTGHLFSMETYKNGTLAAKLDATNIVYDSVHDKWLGYNYSKRTIENKTTESFERGDSTILNINVKPLDFATDYVKVETMDFFELKRYIAQEKLRGSDHIKQDLIEMHNRMNYPFSTIVLTLIGVSLSSRKVRGGIGLHLAIGIALTFSYIIIQKISIVLGWAGNIPPIIAVWIPIFVFAGIAFFLVRKAQK